MSFRRQQAPNHSDSENQERKTDKGYPDMLRFGDQVFEDIKWGQNERIGELRTKYSVCFQKHLSKMPEIHLARNIQYICV